MLVLAVCIHKGDREASIKQFQTIKDGGLLHPIDFLKSIAIRGLLF